MFTSRAPDTNIFLAKGSLHPKGITRVLNGRGRFAGDSHAPLLKLGGCLIDRDPYLSFLVSLLMGRCHTLL